MAEKGISSRQHLPDKLPELAQLVMENEKLRRKHRKVQHRRDHYARLYYRCQADLDEKKWVLHFARIKIRELKAQIAASALSSPTTQEHPPPLSSTHSDIVLPPSQRAHPHHVTQSHCHYNQSQHMPQQQQHHHEASSKSGVPSSIPPLPGPIPPLGSESDSTSPDSGASFSPGVGPRGNSLAHSHPASSFPHPHSHDTQQQASKRKTLLRSMRFQLEDESSGSTTQANEYTSDSEHETKRTEWEHVGKGEGHEQGKVEEEKSEEGEDWVAWVKGRNLQTRHNKVAVSAVPSHQQPQDAWKANEDGRRNWKQAPLESDAMDANDTATPRSPVHFKNSVPPSGALASPLATHRRHLSFEPKLSHPYGYSLSQGTSLAHSPLSPPLPRPQNRKHNDGPRPHVHFSLSQEAYVSSPLYLRKPAFRGAAAVAASRKVMQAQSVAEDCGDFQSPLPRDVDTHPVSDSELEPIPEQSQSAFRKPQVYRQLSQPARLGSPPPSQHPSHQTHPITEITHPPPQPPPIDSPPHSSPLSPPPHSSHLPLSQLHSSARPPPPPPTSHPPSLPTSHIRTHPPLTSPGSPVEVGVVSPEMGVVSQQSARDYSSCPNTARDETLSHEEDGEETGDEGEREERCYESLSAVELLDLLLNIRDPKCIIKKLEIADSGLGAPEAMSVLCRDLLHNKSLRELSLPNNGIGAESLQLLLECFQHCTNIRELKLRGNNIGKRCAPIIKALMEQTSLDSLVLTGNEIEQHGDLLHRALPSDFMMEYDTAEGSVDSGVVVADSDHTHTSLKYLHV